MARLDLITAKARFSRDYDMYAARHQHRGPALAAAGPASAARTPLPQRAESGVQPAPGTQDRNPPRPVATEVVPIDVRLGIGFNLLVITGPNTGGKTVSLKTTGLLCLMAQSGMHIPAGEGSSVPVFHAHPRRHRRRTEPRTIAQHLQLAHLAHRHHPRARPTTRAWCCSTNSGAGTDPTEGAALGRAILDELDQIGCRAMVTTHLGDLKTYAFNNDRAENAAVEFDVETLRPTYRLHIGQFGMSNALKIARRLKLPQDLLQAGAAVPEAPQGQDRRAGPPAATARGGREGPHRGPGPQHEAERQREEYERKQAELEQTPAEEAKLSEWRTRLQPTTRSVAEVRQDREGRTRQPAKVTVVVSIGIGQWEVFLNEVLPNSQKKHNNTKEKEGKQWH